MKIVLWVLFFIPSIGAAMDCSQVKPFESNGTLKVEISVAQFTWNDQSQELKDICKETLTIKSYDVRNREEEAYYCLKPEPTEVLTCKTNVENASGILYVVPATWIRNWEPQSHREYRFHAYVTQENDSGYLKDIFSRTLLSNLDLQDITIEGSLKTGPSNPHDGFFIRALFKK